ncbi:Uma2 family endonuclease [Streptomyces sp. A3M-1-3]|uniref:Uma2 family endonuclease n=1 Tax=Streptomyces sp. A3M-1-3 TaxID=2962044 RepID=UPI0020B84095|nr:Uma2 family endonuclease [Streptomyces sp. A3M-1-3]MCP3822064.1 Uma2 family endonuclease [Streptomyces sp. A3M-1-3]
MALTAPEREPRTDADENTASSVEEAFEALSAAAPEGWRVELIEGEIHVVPPANGEHEEIVSELSGQVRDHRRDLGRFTGVGLLVPGASPTGKVVPDLVIAPKGSFSDQLEYHDPGPVMLVGEVTSDSTADNDRGPKLRGYARAGIPFYLLVDREKGHVILYTEPSGERYTRDVGVEISKTITLPEPFGFDLDTGEF